MAQSRGGGSDAPTPITTAAAAAADAAADASAAAPAAAVDILSVYLHGGNTLNIFI